MLSSVPLCLQIDSDSVPFRKGDPGRRIESPKWGRGGISTMHVVTEILIWSKMLSVRREVKQGRPLPSSLPYLTVWTQFGLVKCQIAPGLN